MRLASRSPPPLQPHIRNHTDDAFDDLGVSAAAIVRRLLHALRSPQQDVLLDQRKRIAGTNRVRLPIRVLWWKYSVAP